MEYSLTTHSILTIIFALLSKYHSMLDIIYLSCQIPLDRPKKHISYSSMERIKLPSFA